MRGRVRADAVAVPAALLAAGLIAALVVGCGALTATPAATPDATPTTSASQTTAPGSMPVTALPPASALASPHASAVPSPPASRPPPATGVDPALLEVLPETVGGVRIVETPEAAFGSIGDPAVARVAARLATGYVVSEAGDDWAVVSVVALRPGAWSEAFYRDWRDSYTASVCEQEGGVGGRAVATIGGHEVDIATCGGLRTYNVHRVDGDLVVSVASAGEARFGEQIMAGLRP